MRIRVQLGQEFAGGLAELLRIEFDIAGQGADFRHDGSKVESRLDFAGQGLGIGRTPQVRHAPLELLEYLIRNAE